MSHKDNFMINKTQRIFGVNNWNSFCSACKRVQH